jgi:S-adenosylmethionine decarboxylase
MLFEGPEKKLEIMIAPDGPSLRSHGDEFWRAITMRARAEVLSRTSNESCDAYLLSESSLFVFDRQMVMITCGKTTLVEAAVALLETIPVAQIDSLIYERKNENFPDQQMTTFDEDVIELEKLAPGVSMIFGDQTADHIALFHLDRHFKPEPDDTALELLMYDFDPDIRERFVTGSPTVRPIDDIGLGSFFEGFETDEHLFNPAGYSFNAIGGKVYATLHVTPQAEGSYVSFETNRPSDSLDTRIIVSRLLDFFKPARSDLLLFQGTIELESINSGFRVTASDSRELACGYSVKYAHIENFPTSRQSAPA